MAIQEEGGKHRPKQGERWPSRPPAPVPADFDLDTLLAAKYRRATDKCGCFSFHASA